MIPTLTQKDKFRYLSDILMGLSSGILQNPKSLSVGAGQGLANANQMLSDRRQQDMMEAREAQNQAQFQMQQEEFARQKQEREAAGKAFTDLMGTGTPKFVGGAGSGPSSFQAPQANPMLSALDPQQLAYLKQRGSVDAPGAFDMLGQLLFQPAKDNKPIVNDGMQYDPSTNSWTPIPGWVDQQKAIAAARQQGPDSSYFGTPIPMVGPDGKPMIGMLGKDGNLHPAATPAGVSVAPPIQWVNTGTAQTPVAKNAGTDIAAAPIPINNQGRATDEAMGKAIAEAKQSLPALTDAVSNATAQIQNIKTDPALNWGTGWTGAVLQKLPDTQWKALATRIDQLKGTSFLQARQLLKGGGQITDYEGAMADRALNRLDSAQSSTDFLQALDEFQTAINQGLARMQYATQGNFTQGGSEQFPMQTAPAAVPPPPAGFQVVQ